MNLHAMLQNSAKNEVSLVLNIIWLWSLCILMWGGKIKDILLRYVELKSSH